MTDGPRFHPLPKQSAWLENIPLFTFLYAYENRLVTVDEFPFSARFTPRPYRCVSIDALTSCGEGVGGVGVGGWVGWGGLLSGVPVQAPCCQASVRQGCLGRAVRA